MQPSSWFPPDWKGRKRISHPVNWARLPGFDVGVAFIQDKKNYGHENRWCLYFRKFNEQDVKTFPVLAQTVITSSPGSTQTLTSPIDWNNNNNTVEAIGAGSVAAIGASTSTSGGGGGGGAYQKIVNMTFATPGTTQYFARVGAVPAAAGTAGDSWLTQTSPGTTFPVSAQVGLGARGATPIASTTTATGSAGGAAASGYANPAGSAVSNNGGTGGSAGASNASGGGGGGAGGQHGAGASPGTGPSAGGNGDGGTSNGGGAGGPAGNGSGANGGRGSNINTVGPTGSGGGGGGGNAGPSTGGAGGLYGAGGGGGGRSNGTAGAGAQGVVVLTWTLAGMGWLSENDQKRRSGPVSVKSPLDNYTTLGPPAAFVQQRTSEGAVQPSDQLKRKYVITQPDDGYVFLRPISPPPQVVAAAALSSPLSLRQITIHDIVAGTPTQPILLTSGSIQPSDQFKRQYIIKQPDDGFIQTPRAVPIISIGPVQPSDQFKRQYIIKQPDDGFTQIPHVPTVIAQLRTAAAFSSPLSLRQTTIHDVVAGTPTAVTAAPTPFNFDAEQASDQQRRRVEFKRQPDDGFAFGQPFLPFLVQWFTNDEIQRRNPIFFDRAAADPIFNPAEFLVNYVSQWLPSDQVRRQYKIIVDLSAPFISFTPTPTPTEGASIQASDQQRRRIEFKRQPDDGFAYGRPFLPFLVQWFTSDELQRRNPIFFDRAAADPIFNPAEFLVNYVSQWLPSDQVLRRYKITLDLSVPYALSPPTAVPTPTEGASIQASDLLLRRNPIFFDRAAADPIFVRGEFLVNYVSQWLNSDYQRRINYNLKLPDDGFAFGKPPFTGIFAQWIPSDLSIRRIDARKLPDDGFTFGKPPFTGIFAQWVVSSDLAVRRIDARKLPDDGFTFGKPAPTVISIFTGAAFSSPLSLRQTTVYDLVAGTPIVPAPPTPTDNTAGNIQPSDLVSRRDVRITQSDDGFAWAILPLPFVPPAVLPPTRPPLARERRRIQDPWCEDEFIPMWLLLDDDP
jgi:hypothetical protein